MTVPPKAGDPLKRVKAVTEDDWFEDIPEPIYAAVPTVDYTPPEIIAVFYDCEGEPLLEIEAPRNPIGFA